MSKKYNIYDMQEIASLKNGKCLSNEYISVKHHLIWECHKGHQWKAIPESILRESWCKVNAQQIKKYKYSIFDLKNISKKKRRACLEF